VVSFGDFANIDPAVLLLEKSTNILLGRKSLKIQILKEILKFASF
jgi:hypothetical protein